MGRLIHVHVPVRLSPKTEEEVRTGEVKRPSTEIMKAMGEKRMALDLIAGFCYALKHHIRYVFIHCRLGSQPDDSVQVNWGSIMKVGALFTNASSLVDLVF